MSLATELITYSTTEVGAAVKRSADWVERRVNGGDCEYLRVGRSVRFTPDQAEAFIRSFTIRPDGAAAPEPEADALRSQTSRSRNRRK